MDLFVLQPGSLCSLHIGPKALNQSDMPLWLLSFHLPPDR